MALATAVGRGDGVGAIPDGPAGDGAAVEVPNPVIVEKSNAAVPLDLEFARWDGREVKLGEVFGQGRAGGVVAGIFFVSEFVRVGAGRPGERDPNGAAEFAGGEGL